MNKMIILPVVILLSVFIAAGCGSGVSEDKPVDEIKQEAQGMDMSQLENIVAKYKQAIEAKKPELQKLQTKLRSIPVTELMGEEAAAIKDDIQKISTSITSLTARMKAYADELRKKQ